MNGQRITLFSIGLWAILWLNGWAQSTDFSVRQYDESRGLSSRYVRFMIQDRQGFMWFGTPDGLNRYDGHTFVTFRKNPLDTNSLAGNYINRLAEDRQGNIWIGYYTGGVSCYNPRRGRFTHYPLQNVAGHDFRGLEVTGIYCDQQDQVWLGIKGEGMVHLDPNTGKTLHYNIVTPKGDAAAQAIGKAYNILYHIYETPQGLFYLITHDGLYSFDRKTQRLRAIHNTAARQRTMHDDVFGPYAVDGDVLWLGSWAGGLSSYNLKTGEWKNYKFDQRILPTTNIISGLCLRGKDTLWLTSLDRGFGYFHKPTARFTFINDKAKLPYPAYYSLLIDQAGAFWMNADDGILSVWPHNKRFPFMPVPVEHKDNPMGHVVHTVFENNQFRLIGTWWADGLQVYNKQTGKRKALAVELLPGEPLQNINDIKIDSQGTIWVVSRDYLYQFDPVNETLIKVKQPPIWSAQQPTNYCLRLQEGQPGTYWLTTAHNGVFRYDSKRKVYTHYAPTAERKLGTSAIRAIDRDAQGRIWIGGKESYLAYFDPAQNRFHSVFLAYKGVNPTRVSALLADPKGYLYVGTDVGLLVYDTRQPIPKAIRVYTGHEGLKGDMVNHMAWDEAGKIWCITQTTLCALDPRTHRIDSYGLQDGIKQVGVGNTLSRLPGGYMAIATDNGGYYRFHPASLRPPKQNQKPVITSFQVHDQEYYYRKELDRNGFVRLEPDESTCSFEFSLLDYQNPDAYQYLYKLEGLDVNWVRAESRRYAAYTNLPGGNYVFRVKAINRTGDLNVPELAIPLYVETIFYATWWFRLGLLLLLLGGSYTYYRKQLRDKEKLYQLQSKANALEKEKALIMYESLKQQLNPHFLFNSLTSLSSLIRVDQKLAGQFLDSLSKMYRYILKNRETELVSLEDELGFVQMYINLQKTRFEHGLQITIDVEESAYCYRIVPVTLQNLIENAIKHNIITVDQPLRIAISSQSDYLVVENNLQKKKFVETSNRQGLANLISFYRYLSDKPVQIGEDTQIFTIKIPLV